MTLSRPREMKRKIKSEQHKERQGKLEGEGGCKVRVCYCCCAVVLLLLGELGYSRSCSLSGCFVIKKAKDDDDVDDDVAV